MLETRVATCPCAADVAATGEDALWMAQAHAYDAIVLDVMLPG
jgi:DNA-binding response OmpR family regulator